MNFRTTYILFGAVALILVVFLLMLAFGPSGDADDYVLSAIRETIGKKGDKQKDVIKSITRFEIERLSPSGETLVFTRTTDGWKLEMPYEAKIDGKVIEDAVSRLVEARIDRKADITHRLAEPRSRRNAGRTNRSRFVRTIWTVCSKQRPRMPQQRGRR